MFIYIYIYKLGSDRMLTLCLFICTVKVTFEISLLARIPKGSREKVIFFSGPAILKGVRGGVKAGRATKKKGTFLCSMFTLHS